MRFELIGYQNDAAADIVDAIGEGFTRFTKNGRLTAVSLAAPTGAGKTVIATAVIEKLLHGDDTTEPNPDLTVLWVTDDPSLNQQTRNKMMVASSAISPGELVIVDPSLDQKYLDRGRVYFVHIQQLGKGATNYVKTGDKRQYSLWDTIANTIADRGTDFVLVVDEAHKGTATKAGGGKTITARLIDGAGGQLPATPVVLGISATPDRFVESITKAGHRTLEPVNVDPQAVRDSGLLKDKLRIRHPDETQPGDSTLLEMAVDALREMTDLWDEYSAAEGEPEVRPALVIQVRAKVSDAELRAILDTLAGAWNVLDGKAVAHAFQEHTTLNLGDRSVRYVAPQNIQDDPHLRVVLFKEALTTGWDCPRAEVMVSFRTAKDYTYIAQLIGRMVRTPLARRVTTDQVLNTVSLYLPYYDEDQVAQVVARLQSDESNITTEIEIDPVTCKRNPDVPDAVWDLLAELPTYTRPGKHHRNEVARLNALATLLVGHGFDETAMATARRHIVDTLAREAERLGSALDDKVADYERLEYQDQVYDFETGTTETETGSALINARNIEDLFRRSKRLLGDAAAKWYWDELCDDGMDPDEAKLHVAAVASDPSVPVALETAAKGLVDTWRKKHNGAIAELPDPKKAEFFKIWSQAKAPEEVRILWPTQISAADKRVDKAKDGTQSAVALPRHRKHLYVNGRGTFPAKVTGWEADVLAAELEKDTLVGWYRNPTAGTGALAVPYEQSGTARTLYPDFLFVHEVDGNYVVDIVDPHRPDAGDTGPKWRGLAAYAAEHGTLFRRILAVIKDSNDNLLSLDLKNAAVAAALADASNETDIRKVFDALGGSY